MLQNWKEKITFHVEKSRHPLVVVLGPTASGKTAFSLQVANVMGALAAEVHEPPLQRMHWKGAEIINADSRQLYRFMDIGTAKIRPDEMRGIPHHLLDVLDPKEEATAAWYKTEATRVIRELHKRGNVPILVGGSMLYISALLDDLQFVAGADPKVRKKLEEQYDADGGAALYARLEEADPETASAFSMKNKPYVIRAVEILEGGKRPSDAKHSGACPWDVLILGMQLPREELVARINARTKAMFEQGWFEEVQSLLDRGYSLKDPGMKSHGYREIAEAIANGKWTLRPGLGQAVESGKCDLKDLHETIAAKTRQYAKRQMTWWKGDQRIQWIDASAK